MSIKPAESTSVRWDGMWVTIDGPVRLRCAWTGPSDLVMLARGPEGWLLAILGERKLRVNDAGSYEAGAVTARIKAFADVDALAATIVERYHRSGWIDLLDATRRHAPELYPWWLPHQIHRELDACSVYNSGLDERSLDEAVRQVAASALRDAGYQVIAERRPARHDDLCGNRVAGALTVRRRGWEFEVLVGLDDAGEVYTRIRDRDTPAHRQRWGELSHDAAPLAEP